MHHAQQKKFDSLYKKHLNALKRQGKSESTIDVYTRAVRRVSDYLDCCPDKLSAYNMTGTCRAGSTTR